MCLGEAAALYAQLPKLEAQKVEDMINENGGSARRKGGSRGPPVMGDGAGSSSSLRTSKTCGAMASHSLKGDPAQPTGGSRDTSAGRRSARTPRRAAFHSVSAVMGNSCSTCEQTL